MTLRSLILLATALFGLRSFALAQTDSIPVIKPPVYTTQQIVGKPPVVDGVPDDSAWMQVPWSENFTQYEPSDTAAATQRSQFKILYDKRFLYIAWRCYDNTADGPEVRLGRRDNFPGRLDRDQL